MTILMNLIVFFKSINLIILDRRECGKVWGILCLLPTCGLSTCCFDPPSGRDDNWGCCWPNKFDIKCQESLRSFMTTLDSLYISSITTTDLHQSDSKVVDLQVEKIIKILKSVIFEDNIRGEYLEILKRNLLKIETRVNTSQMLLDSMSSAGNNIQNYRNI